MMSTSHDYLRFQWLCVYRFYIAVGRGRVQILIQEMYILPSPKSEGARLQEAGAAVRGKHLFMIAAAEENVVLFSCSSFSSKSIALR